MYLSYVTAIIHGFGHEFIRQITLIIYLDIGIICSNNYWSRWFFRFSSLANPISHTHYNLIYFWSLCILKDVTIRPQRIKILGITIIFKIKFR